MKKRFILFMILPTISLIANTNNFYDRIYALQKHKQNLHASTQRKASGYSTPKKVYRSSRGMRYNTRPMVSQRATPLPLNNRVSKVKINAVDARKFFFAQRAAKNGNPKAQFDLAIMYATGRGVQKNEKIAFNWFHKSARNNYAPAKHYMGISFLQGRGVRRQTELARYWFRLAVKQGYRDSMFYLSKIDSSRV